jgi:hypothetical protein
MYKKWWKLQSYENLSGFLIYDDEDLRAYHPAAECNRRTKFSPAGLK